MEKYPPYTITNKMLNYVSNIMKKIGEANYFEKLNRFPEYGLILSNSSYALYAFFTS